MNENEQIFFIICMILYFGVSLFLILVPNRVFKVYMKLYKLFGLKISYSAKAIVFGRILGVLLFIWGIFIILISQK